MKLLALLVLLGGSYAGAAELKTIEPWYIPNKFEFSTHTYVTLGAQNRADNYSTFTVQGIILTWVVEAVGSTASFRTAHSTVSDSNYRIDLTTYAVHTSSWLTLRTGQNFN